MRPPEIVPVSLAGGSYEIRIGGGLLRQLGAFCSRLSLTPRAVIVTEPAVKRLYARTISASLRGAGFRVATAEVPRGERAKSLAQTARLYDAFLRHRLDRQSPVIALGGGVIGDLAGYAAATYLRGVPLVHVPTTLLAQVDSSIGGKVGVNLPKGKNLVGAFYQPSLVVADIRTLKSLPPRELRAGLAEVVKHGLIADAELFEYIETNLDAILAAEEEPLVHLVTRSCRIKGKVVEQDERDQGIRAILNFGHTVAHAIEAATGFRRFLHGEAVAIGMIVATTLSIQRGLCDEDVLRRLRSLLHRIGLPVTLPIDEKLIIKTAGYDKKVKNNIMYFVLTKGIGHVTVAPVSEPAEFRHALAAVRRATTPPAA
jgi:3-dehydroquinate synthase